MKANWNDFEANMDTFELRIVARVASVLSITTVANELELAPSTITKKIQGLEAELGIQIFDRTTRCIRVTDEGRVFLAGCGKILAATDDVVAEIEELCENVRGSLKISVPKSIGHVDLGSCIADFLLAYPEISVQVDFSQRYANLQEEGYDIAIRTGELCDSSLMARRIGDDPQVIVASPAYLSRCGTPRRPQDLAKHDCLVLGDQHRWSFKRKTSTYVARVTGRLRANDASALFRNALKGVGVVRMSRALVVDEIASGRLVELLKDYDISADAAVHAVFLNTKHVPPRLRAFIDHTADWLRNDKLAMDGETRDKGGIAAHSGVRLGRVPKGLASKDPKRGHRAGPHVS